MSRSRSVASRRLWVLPVLALLLALVVAACDATEGEDGRFDPLTTTNTDFQAPVLTAVGNNPVTMDFTCTGGVNAQDCAPPALLDRVAVVNTLADSSLAPETSGTVVLLRSDGNGTFTELQRLTTLPFPTRAWLRHLNADTNLDLVVLDNLNRRVAIYLHNGTAWPAEPSQVFPFSAGFEVAQAEVTDLTGDGRPDVVLTVPARTELIALVNGGTGTFTQQTTTAPTGLSRFVVGQFNPAAETIAFPDLAILNVSNSQVELWMGNGAGGFVQSAVINVTPNARDIAGAANLLGTGGFGFTIATDRITDEDFGALMVVGLNTSGGVSFNEERLELRNFTNQVFVLNGPGTSAPYEILATHSNDVYVSLRHRTGGNPTTLETTRNVVGVASGQINGGGPDFVTAEAQFRVLGVFAGDGAGGYTRTQIAFTTRVTFPRLVNVNNTGQLDLLVLQPNSDRLAVLLNRN